MQTTLDNGGGDYDCLIHGSFSLEGKTSSCGQKSKSLATLIKDSRLCAAAFWRHGLRKGDIVHFVIPNNTEYHNLALGVWTCEGTLSLGDPDLSVSVLKTQLKASQLFSQQKIIRSSAKVHSFLKQCLHNPQLIQFGGTFTKPIS